MNVDWECKKNILHIYEVSMNLDSNFENNFSMRIIFESGKCVIYHPLKGVLEIGYDKVEIQQNRIAFQGSFIHAIILYPIKHPMLGMLGSSNNTLFASRFDELKNVILTHIPNWFHNHPIYEF